MDYNNIATINFGEIIQHPDFNHTQYYRSETNKKQICLHHTASGMGVDGDIRHFLSDPLRICTPVIISYDGTVHQLHSTKYWGHHLGIKRWIFRMFGLPSINRALNEMCIGVEIDSWGPLASINGKFYSWAGTEVSADRVVYYEKGFKDIPDSHFFRKKGVVGDKAHYYESYTDAQIYATAQLLNYWSKRYRIPIESEYPLELFNTQREALIGRPGLYTHNSYRPDKQDIHPQREMLVMLSQLKNKF